MADEEFNALGPIASSQLAEMTRWWYRTHRNPHAPPPRQPVIRTSGLVAYRITAVPGGGRREYTGQRIKYVVTVVGSQNVLSTTVSGDPIKIYNILESNTDGPTYRFLVVGDEVAVWQQDGVNVCCEVPRGFN